MQWVTNPGTKLQSGGGSGFEVRLADDRDKLVAALSIETRVRTCGALLRLGLMLSTVICLVALPKCFVIWIVRVSALVFGA